ncbi:1-phosphofructokinase family hexose kinase [Streptacidiphilus sp. MAP5-3]|uniref:1-phosphofructokinase family hexose kinase n=1 Tax=Streptacidiphilus sp. MAP5-3 TaxID=3156265 RepID=UPI003517F504
MNGSTRMILTVTLNAALDVTYVVDALRPGTTHRVRSVAERAGGKGVNTARVLTHLGEKTLALGLAGGATGAVLRADLDASGIPHRFTPIAGPTRRAVAVVSGGDVTGLWEPGPVVADEEWQRFVRDYFTPALDRAGAVVLSGSLPPGVPGDAYAQLVRLAAEAGVPALVDADGPALRAALAAAPALAKPNVEEARRALGYEHEPPAASDLPAALVAAGARAAVVSAGADGLTACWNGERLHVAPPRAVSGNPTGAGDAASAALALARDTPPAEALADAVALSAAAVAAPLAGDFDARLYAQLRPPIAPGAPPCPSSR